MARLQAMNVALLISGYSGYYLCRSNLSVSMPLLIAELQRRGMAAGGAQILLGTISSYGVLAYALGKFPSGSLADRFGGKRNFIFGMAGSIVFTLLMAASGAVPLFTLAWIGNRFVQSLGWAGAVKIVSRWYSYRSYGTVMAIVSLSYLFGDALARQGMAALLSVGLGWRAVFVAAAAGLAVLLAFCAWRLRESPGDAGLPEPSPAPTNLFMETGRSQKGPPASFAGLLRPFLSSRLFCLACALSFGTTILRETFTLWTPTYLMQTTGMTAAESAGASALFPLLGGVSVVACGCLSDRLGRGGRAILMLAGLTIAGVVLLAIGSGIGPSSRNSAMGLVAVVAFLVLGPYSLLAGAISLDFGGKQGSGTASGLIDGVGYLGGVISGGGMASIAVHYGWSAVFVVLAAISLASAAASGVFLHHEWTVG